MISPHIANKSAEVSMQHGMRPKHITNTDQSIHITIQEATVSSQEGMRPKFNTSMEKSPAVCSKVLQCVACQDQDNTTSGGI